MTSSNHQHSAQQGGVPKVKTDIVLHIGMPKTGSSAIQKFCLENHAWLLDAGYYYPAHTLDRNGISGGHSDLYLLIKSGELEKAKSLLTKYIDEARQRGATLLVSNEGSHMLCSEYASLLEGLSVKVVGFFRHPVENLFSAYNQQIKRHFHTKPLFEYVRQSIRAEKPVMAGETILEWHHVFKQAVSILPYSKSHQGKQSALYQFLNFLGVDDASINKRYTDKRVNSGYSPAILELKRLINLCLDKDEFEFNADLDLFLQHTSDKSLESHYPVEATIPKDMLLSLEEKFASSVQLIEDTYGITLNYCAASQNFERYHPAAQLKEMITVTDELKRAKPRHYQKIVDKIKAIQWGVTGHDECKLFELFDIPLHDVQHIKSCFFEAPIEKKLPDYEKVDFLRELAVVYWNRADLDNAYKLISKAKELRPSGPVIKKLHAEIKNQFEDSQD